MKSPFFLSLCILVILWAATLNAQTSPEQNFDDSLKTAEEKGLTYLPDFIVERQMSCKAYESPEKQTCLEKLAQHVQGVLSCPSSLRRFQEGRTYDHELAKASFLKNPIVQAPESLLKNFEKLRRVMKLSGRFPIQLSLILYDGTERNAHAAVGGDIFISQGLLQGENALSLPEVTAVIAHEITHVVEEHGMILNCMAIEWTDSNFSVSLAQSAFQEDFRGSSRFEKWSEVSQQLEYRADLGAVHLLQAAGLEPELMSQALAKLKPQKAPEGFASGSHPEFDARIQRALQESNKLKAAAK